VVKRAGAPAIELDNPIVQTLSFVSLGEPTPAMFSVVSATRRIAAKVLE
jgi:hypothetical protein